MSAPRRLEETTDLRPRGRRGMTERKRRLANEPVCRHCKAKGISREATVPDHIVALAHGGTDDDTNIQCLCEDCHDAKTRNEFGLRRAVAVDHDGWPIETPGGGVRQFRTFERDTGREPKRTYPQLKGWL